MTSVLLAAEYDTPLNASAHFWLLACRLGMYATLNLLDDPALLALAFC